MSEPPGLEGRPRPPSVDALARRLADCGLPHRLLVEVARACIEQDDVASAPARAQALARSLLGPVINATGVLLHTNLGRAPVASPARPGRDAPCFRYSNLELDMSTGRRGSRRDPVGALLARAGGAEAALVVNNGAAAVLLALTSLAKDREVIVSRGELVEIGGGFRIPDVLAASGARLVEVGTTNRTRPADYAQAVGPDTAMVLKVHQSNYRIVGFTESASVSELSLLGPILVADIGSGLLDETTPWLDGGPPAWLHGEPAVRQTLAQGADLVCFSGDKLLGGPQAGVIAGRRDLIDSCAAHPLYRALRPGGMVLTALEDVALTYLRGDGSSLPLWRMANAPLAALQARAGALGVGEVVRCVSVLGGGSIPGAEIASAGVAIDADLSLPLRHGDPPVVARVQSGRTIIDLRTVDPADDETLAKAVMAAMSQAPGEGPDRSEFS
ncbi:MAG: L-seryl-tRNA(Sec) selenium transferase [Acidimicrobiales bacterium]